MATDAVKAGATVRDEAERAPNLERRVEELAKGLEERSRAVLRPKKRGTEPTLEVRDSKGRLRYIQEFKTWRALDWLKRLGICVLSR